MCLCRRCMIRSLIPRRLEPRPSRRLLVGLVAIDRGLVAADQPVGDLALGGLGRGQHHPPDQPRPLVDAEMRLVAEEGAPLLAGPVGAGLARVPGTRAGLVGRRARSRRHQRGVHQRALAHDQTGGLQLAVDLLEGRLQNPARIPAKAADRGLVRRAPVKRKAAKTPERQTVQQRLLQTGVRQIVKHLKIKRLQHRQRRIGRTAPASRADRRRQALQRRPVDQRIQTIKLPVRPKTRRNKRFRKTQLTLAAHRRLQRLMTTLNHITNPLRIPFSQRNPEGEGVSVRSLAPVRGRGIGISFCTLAPVRGRGMRRLGEPASHSRSWVRGNFHITLTPTLTPALSLREGEGVSVDSLAPFPGERGRVRARKKETPLIGSGP